MHADRARPAPEACGIDVSTMAKRHDFPIHVVRNHKEARDLFGVILVE
jgi:predicted metal-binding protein